MVLNKYSIANGKIYNSVIIVAPGVRMVESVLQSLLFGLPVLVMHFAVTTVMLIVGIRVYTRITPLDEFRLIREGNIAAAVSLSGACLGLAIPLAFCMAASVNTVDIVLWGVAAIAIQLIGFRVTDWLLKELPSRIEAGEMGPAILLVGIKMSIAVINAAAIAG
jgi:putative membrane protein